MSNLKKFKYLLVLYLILIGGCSKILGSEPKIEITVSAATSLTNSLIEIKDHFIHEYPEVNIVYNFGGSGTLRKQIEQGANIDLFFSASEQDYKLLKEANFIEHGSLLFKNNLVIVKRKQSEFNSFKEFLQANKRIAIGTPEIVPAGAYAKEALQGLGEWDEIQDKLVYTNSVSQVVTYVEEGAVEAGIVYSSDVHGSENIEVMTEFDQNLHAPIFYYVGIVKNDKEQIKEYAEKYYEYVLNEDSMDIFTRHGFEIYDGEVGD